MLESVSGKYSYYTIRAGTIEAHPLCRAGKGAWYFNVHPLQEFALLVKDVDVAVSSQHENFGNLDGDTDKNLLLDFSKVSRYRLKNLLVFALLTDHGLSIVV